MNPRDRIHRTAALCAAAALFVFAAPAAATVTGVAVHPSAPTTCDPVTLTAEGTFGGCDSVVSAEVSEPEEIPEWAGPLPAYVTRIRVTVLRDGTRCPAIIKLYTRDFAMGPLPMGQHFVRATEWVVDPEGALLDSSEANTTFTVTAREACDTEPCVLLGFMPRITADVACDARATPGGQGCFHVGLFSTIPVGGVQCRIQITDDRGQPLPAGSFTPTMVATTARSAGMQVAWQADGSAIEVMLFSTTGASIPPGHEPILRACYDVGANVAPDVYSMRFELSLVADTNGNELFPCPTFRQSLGRFCVGEILGCDVDGDGGSDIRDIIRLVRCALAGEACPDTIAAHADCNEDGAVDVRDVICCVRRLLAQPSEGALNPPQAPGIWAPLRIGFTGAAAWTSGLAGRATIELVPDLNFGGTEFQVAPSDGIRITSLTAGPGWLVQWERDVEGVARAVLLRQGSLVQYAPVRVTVGFERVGSGFGSAGELRIENVRTASWDDAAYAPYVVTAGAAAIPAGSPAAPQIHAARPNPFSGATEIPYSLPAAGRVSLRVFDVSGRLVRTLIDGERPAGVGRAAWDGKDASNRPLPAGVYFAKLSAAGVERTTRIMRLR